MHELMQLFKKYLIIMFVVVVMVFACSNHFFGSIETLKPENSMTSEALHKLEEIKVPEQGPSDVTAIDKDEKPVEAKNSEMIETAESVVYRPLFVYRKIVHSKRRINMYNAFAG